MSSIKDKELLLLGILSHHSVHGYELNELLKSPSTAIRIGKANAYQLLAKLEREDLVTGHEERIDRRPPRTVYTITSAGRARFEHLLKSRLAEFQPIEYPDGVSLNFIDTLDLDDAIPLLEERATRLADRCATLSGFSDDIRAAHPGLDFLIRLAELEKSFMQELIEKLKRKHTHD
ncbi:MAG: helix-turn-helix transcriptional regulator [Anaerolineales bacterium]|nr:helix-turn-helix transcriptional regulator [Anaerolineales bacterium]MCB0017147.1 helix-turn-helix transcriptional regulator [Anaerolineales bacterium]MCB0027844.1 helix-turn-helix transcriptional regulator [Anaerolineales bacterium]MCB8962387.1 helix-turn-helix transcriptional regulator [Ardenticatenales bacterium]